MKNDKLFQLSCAGFWHGNVAFGVQLRCLVDQPGIASISAVSFNNGQYTSTVLRTQSSYHQPSRKQGRLAR